jgi:hypothetical protein
MTSHYEEIRWKLDQEREKTRMFRRHLARTPYRMFARRYVLGMEEPVR